jgi:hypothetical protein
MSKRVRILWWSLFLIMLSSMVYAAETLLPPAKQKELCLAIIEKIEEIDRSMVEPDNKMEEAIAQKAPHADILSAAQKARDSIDEAQKSFFRVQLDLPDGLKKETESALNDYAYHMKTAYTLRLSVYQNFVNALEKDASARIDHRRDGEFYQELAKAIEFEQIAKETVGIED